ncbi:MAG: hypothetical protein COA99_08705 [Moraxellaceae bacterium]|nr:MAG: hypothetical protein COA99_08705 [Moraxellaceae bacterium]
MGSYLMSNIDIVRTMLQEQVPLLKHLGISVSDYGDLRAVVEAPLAPNINTHGTAFAGSLYCVGAMTGWSLVHLSLMDAGHQPSVVLASAEITYKRPVTHGIKATTSIDRPTFEAFLEDFESKGKARLTADVSIHCEGKEAVKMTAQYVAFNSPASKA